MAGGGARGEPWQSFSRKLSGSRNSTANRNKRLRSWQPGKIVEAPAAGRFAPAAIAIFGAFLLLLLMGGLVQVRLVTQEQQRLLPNYLSLVGRTVASPQDYFFFLEFMIDAESGEIDQGAAEDYFASPFWARAVAHLQTAEAEEFVRTAEILSVDGRRLLGADGLPPAPNGEEARTDAEREAIARAAAGEIAAPTVPRDDLHRSIYAPIRSAADGPVIALLRLEAEAERFAGLERLRNRLFTSFVLTGLLFLFLYVTTVRLMRRTIDAEKAIARADRLRALGTMTAGIAHEIRNPLGILMLEVEEMEAAVRQLPDSKPRSEISRVAVDLKDEIRRLRKLTENFLSFSGASSAASLTLAPVDVAATLEPLYQVWSKSVDSARRKVSMDLPSPGDGGLFARFEEDRLRQIVLNLLRNADEALGEQEGSIRLSAAREAREIVITVSDTGPGIEPAILNQIFDPFFTTRAEGSGLGLSLSRALAESAGGSLLVESQRGKGAAFTLRLPISEESP